MIIYEVCLRSTNPPRLHFGGEIVSFALCSYQRSISPAFVFLVIYQQKRERPTLEKQERKPNASSRLWLRTSKTLSMYKHKRWRDQLLRTGEAILTTLRSGTTFRNARTQNRDVEAFQLSQYNRTRRRGTSLVFHAFSFQKTTYSYYGRL